MLVALYCSVYYLLMSVFTLVVITLAVTHVVTMLLGSITLVVLLTLIGNVISVLQQNKE